MLSHIWPFDAIFEIGLDTLLCPIFFRMSSMKDLVSGTWVTMSKPTWTHLVLIESEMYAEHAIISGFFRRLPPFLLSSDDADNEID